MTLLITKLAKDHQLFDVKTLCNDTYLSSRVLVKHWVARSPLQSIQYKVRRSVVWKTLEYEKDISILTKHGQIVMTISQFMPGKIYMEKIYCGLLIYLSCRNNVLIKELSGTL